MPQFLIVGAAKAGTTTIHDVLGQHPDIFLPSIKELHFFDDEASFAMGCSWYEKNFSAAAADQVAGEATPAYMSYSYVPQRIHEMLGEHIKLIFSLREPVARAYSEYLHNKRRGFFSADFDEAIQWEFDRAHLSPWERRKFSFISRGYYARQIRQFLNYFPRSQMFFLVMEEDLGLNSTDTFKSLQEFIGVRQHNLDFTTRSNVAYEPRSMALQKVIFNNNPLRRWARTLVASPRVRQQLRKRLMLMNSSKSPPAALTPDRHRELQERFYADEIEQLEGLLGRKLGTWRMDRRSDR